MYNESSQTSSTNSLLAKGANSMNKLIDIMIKVVNLAPCLSHRHFLNV